LSKLSPNFGAPCHNTAPVSGNPGHGLFHTRRVCADRRRRQRGVQLDLPGRDGRDLLSVPDAPADEAPQGGLLGRIIEVGDNFVLLEIAEQTQVKVQKHMIAAVLPKGTSKSL
jgi:hypothetical protein